MTPTSTAMGTTTSPLTYEAAIKRLDDLTHQMENGDIPIDDLAAHLKEAQQLIVFCRSKLTQAEEEVTKLLGSDTDNAAQQ